MDSASEAAGPTVPDASLRVVDVRALRTWIVTELSANWGSEVIVALVIVALSVGIGIDNPVFFNSQNLLNIVQSVSVVGIAAIGATFVVISANLDLSVGSTISLCGLIAPLTMETGAPFVVGVLAAVGVGCVVGVLNGALVTKGRVNSFIVTLATLSIVQGAALLATHQHPLQMPNSSLWLGQGNVGPVPNSAICLVSLTILAQLYLSRTTSGQRITAVGDNSRAAFLSGIPVSATIVLAFVIAGGCAGFAGVLNASTLANAQPDAGANMLLTVAAGVIIGGTSLSGGRGSVIGTLLGSVLLGIMNDAFILLALDTTIQVVSVGFVIVIAALFDQWRIRRLRT
jgi:ribose/xylose/arabinose/galactoside ABC-type transport system permease subunit